MEGVASATAILELVSFTGKLLVAGYGYLAKVRRAPVEIRALMRETAALNALLAQLQDLAVSAEEGDAPDGALQQLEKLGVFRDCETVVRLIEKGIKWCDQEDGKRLKNLGRQALWPFKEKEMEGLQAQLRLIIEALSTAVAVDSAKQTRNVENIAKSIDRNVIESLAVAIAVQTSVKSTEEKLHSMKDALDSSTRQSEMISVRKWLHPDAVESDAQYKAALKQRQPGTGTWLPNTSQFQSWENDQGGSYLWLYGIAGSGKTVLAATAIEYLRWKSSPNDIGSSTVLYFFCEHRSPDKRSFRNLLHVLVKQLLDRGGSSFDDAIAWRKQRFPNTVGVAEPLAEVEYVELIRHLCSQSSLSYLVVDALDECSDLPSFAKGLEALTQGSTMKTMITSRHDIELVRAVSKLSKYALSVTDCMRDDIEILLESELSHRLSTGSLKLKTHELLPQIISTLKRKADGMILLAKLHLDYISGLKSDRAIKKAMFELPSTVYATYDKILRQLLERNPTDFDDAWTILQWLVYCETPLTLRQVAEIVSIRPNDRDFDESGIATDLLDLAASLGSLVSLHTEDTTAKLYPDLRGPHLTILTLAHYSVEEYLRSGKMAADVTSRFALDPRGAHLHCAKLCLQYIGLGDFDEPIREAEEYDVFKVDAEQSVVANRQLLRDRNSKYEFYDYACRYWADHLRQGLISDALLDDELTQLLSWFLDQSGNPSTYISWQQMYHHDVVYYCNGRPPLHYAIEFGIQPLIAYLFPAPEFINALASGLSPLAVAAGCGSVATINRLLAHGAEVDVRSAKDGSGTASLMTPLQYAAEGGHTAAIKALLAAGADVETMNESGSRVMLRAARSGSLSAMKTLWDAGAALDPADRGKATPLYEAVTQGRPRVACQLLWWGADPAVMSSRVRGSALGVLARAQKCGSEEMLTEIKRVRQEGGGPGAFEYLFKRLTYSTALLKQMEKDTRPGTEREKDWRWSRSRIMTSASFRDRPEEPYYI